MLRRLLAAVSTLLVVAGLGSTAFAAPAATPLVSPVERSRPKPAAIVSIGDSYLSGEAAGPYDLDAIECRRSPQAAVFALPADGIDARINLACSGATTDDVVRGGSSRHGEPPQAEQLQRVAREFDVRAVIVSVGGNDLGFGSMLRDCLVSFLPLVAPCRGAIEADLDARLATVGLRVGHVLADVRAVMAGAGYAPGDWTLLLQSYPSPVTEKVRSRWLRPVHGCPFSTTDLAFARSVLVPSIARTWAGVAAAHDARFVDLSRAFEGREACARDAEPGAEWVQGLTVDLRQLWPGSDQGLFDGSLHPNAAGHAQIGRCLGRALVADVPGGACVRGPDGNLTFVAA